MNKEDLNIDDYYYGEYNNTRMEGFSIVKGTKGLRPNLYTGSNTFNKQNNSCVNKNIRLATPEEKHWLNECIRLDKFITKEEAMKSFVSEYLKLFNKIEGIADIEKSYYESLTSTGK